MNWHQIPDLDLDRLTESLDETIRQEAIEEKARRNNRKGSGPKLGLEEA